MYRYSVQKLSAFGVCSERPDEGSGGGNIKLNTLLYLVLKIMLVVQCAIDCMGAEYFFFM